LLGGIQINTPAGMPDHFLPLRFNVYNNKAERLETMLDIPCRVRASLPAPCRTYLVLPQSEN
jgi:hypothetical protein